MPSHNQEKAEAGCFPPGHREPIRGRSPERPDPSVPWYRNPTTYDGSGSRGAVMDLSSGRLLFVLLERDSDSVLSADEQGDM